MVINRWSSSQQLYVDSSFWDWSSIFRRRPNSRLSQEVLSICCIRCCLYVVLGNMATIIISLPFRLARMCAWCSFSQVIVDMPWFLGWVEALWRWTNTARVGSDLTPGLFDCVGLFVSTDVAVNERWASSSGRRCSNDSWPCHPAAMATHRPDHVSHIYLENGKNGISPKIGN